MKTQITLPYFSGFYESAYLNEYTFEGSIIDIIDDYKDLHEGKDDITPDDIIIDYEGYKKEVAETFVEEWRTFAPLFIKSARLIEIDSPRFYNFRTDELIAEIEMDKAWKDEIKQFMSENYSDLKERIKREWTSRDGFWSFIDSDIDKWGAKLFDDENPTYIGIIIAYYMEWVNEDTDIDAELEDAVCERVCTANYVSIREKM